MSPAKYHSPSFFLIIIAFTLSTFLQQHAIIIRADSSSPQNYLHHICSGDGGGNSSNYSSYETNLNKLFGYLTCRAPPTGFGLGSFGQATGTGTNNPHAVALCRGDVSPAVCKDCILHATNDVVQRCRPGDRCAVIWYDNCLLKYSDTKFFGQIDYRNKFYMANAQNVSDPASFDGKVRELLGRLAGEAASSSISKLYSAGEMEVDGSTKVYGLTQCSRDLIRNECNKCLQGIIGELPRCCNGRQGGRVVGASCNFIYEIYPFLNV